MFIYVFSKEDSDAMLALGYELITFSPLRGVYVYSNKRAGVPPHEYSASPDIPSGAVVTNSLTF